MAPCRILGEDWIGLGTATKIQTWIGNGRTEFDAAAGRPLERMIGRRQDPPRSGPNSRPGQPATLGPPCQCQPTALLEPSLSHPPSGHAGPRPSTAGLGSTVTAPSFSVLRSFPGGATDRPKLSETRTVPILLSSTSHQRRLRRPSHNPLYAHRTVVPYAPCIVNDRLLTWRTAWPPQILPTATPAEG